ncbi:MAG: lysophospholipid acyltransferase family protein [Chloroflexota bacterium]
MSRESAAGKARAAAGAPWQARFCRAGIAFIGRRVFGFRFEIEGREMIPPGESLIVAGGPHRNWIDGFLLLLALPPEPRVIFLASRAGLFNTRFKRAVLAVSAGFAPVENGGMLNRDALETGLAVLERGGRLGIFPEGGRHLEDLPERMGEAQRGVAFLAMESGRRALPVAIAGGKPLWRGKTLRVRIGSPLDPPPPGSGKPEQQAWAAGLRDRLDDLIPPQPPIPADGRMPWPWLTTIFD